MPLLSCLDYYRPILQSLQDHPEGMSGTRLAEHVTDATGLAAEERAETTLDGGPTYVLRIKQARYRLKSRDLVDESADGRWIITEAGRQALQGARPLLAYRSGPGTSADALPVKENASPAYTATFPIGPTAAFPIGHDDANAPHPTLPTLPIGQGDAADAPLERVERALREIQEQVESDLLRRLCLRPPKFFERAVLKLLQAMGYGEPEHTGGAGDRGIDGILYADRLGLERVYVQAKRKQRDGAVGPDEIRDFCGALSMKHATKGVFITSGRFSKQAQDDAGKAPQALRLIDGKRLAALMREFGIGVSRVRVQVIPEVDLNFFDEE
jgi:restriction system protein